MLLLPHSKEAEPRDPSWTPASNPAATPELWGPLLGQGGLILCPPGEGDREGAHTSSEVPSASGFWGSDTGNN